MPKKKKTKKRWQLRTWLPRKKKKKSAKKKGNLTGNVVASGGKKKTTWRKYGHFCQSRKNSPLLNFLSILERKYFGRPKEKTPGPHHLFSFLLTQPNTLQKGFPSYFLSKIFHPPCFTSKQTHPKNFLSCFYLGPLLLKYLSYLVSFIFIRSYMWYL